MKKNISMFRSIVVVMIIVALLIVASSTMAKAATTSGAKLSFIAPVSGNMLTGQTQTVKWSSTNYKLPVVSIRLLRKVSSNPASYEVVRTISDEAINDGSAIWVPTISDTGSNLVLEIGCKNSAMACEAGVARGSSLAVIKSDRYLNTASAFKAIEALNNKK